jgi:hypothetical protein
MRGNAMVRTAIVGIVLTGVCVAFADSVRAQEPGANIEKAKKAYSDNTDKARNALSEAFTTATKAAIASGSLDVVKTLQAEKEGFENSGKLPLSPRMRTAAVNYQLATKQATTTLGKAYEQAVKDLTKAGKLAQAEAAQAELKEFRTEARGINLRPADVTTKEDLQKYLTETAWTLGDGLRFKSDGHVEQKFWASGNLVVRWEAIDRRTVLLRVEKGREENRYEILTFAEDLSEFGGYEFNGKDRVSSCKRKP